MREKRVRAACGRYSYISDIVAYSYVIAGVANMSAPPQPTDKSFYKYYNSRFYPTKTTIDSIHTVSYLVSCSSRLFAVRWLYVFADYVFNVLACTGVEDDCWKCAHGK